jgi:hypothetical protein
MSFSPGAEAAVSLPGEANLTRAHRRLANHAEAEAVLRLPAAQPATGLDVGAQYLWLAPALAAELGGAGAAVRSGAGGDGDLGRWRHGGMLM